MIPGVRRRTRGGLQTGQRKYSFFWLCQNFAKLNDWVSWLEQRKILSESWRSKAKLLMSDNLNTQ